MIIQPESVIILRTVSDVTYIWTCETTDQTLDLPHKMQGFTRFVVKTNKSWFTRFGGKILNLNFHPCKKFDILQVCLYIPVDIYMIYMMMIYLYIPIHIDVPVHNSTAEEGETQKSWTWKLENLKMIQSPWSLSLS